MLLFWKESWHPPYFLRLQESSYGATTSKIRAWIGIVTGALGTLISIPAIVSVMSNY